MTGVQFTIKTILMNSMKLVNKIIAVLLMEILLMIITEDRDKICLGKKMVKMMILKILNRDKIIIIIINILIFSK